MPSSNPLATILTTKESEITSRWLALQAESGKRMSAAEQQQAEKKSRELIAALKTAATGDRLGDITSAEWDRVRDILGEVSDSRARAWYTPSEKAIFIFSLKQPLFSILKDSLGSDAKALADATWQTTELLDKLGLFTVETFQKTREEVIARQQQELMELSTPVVRLWENVLALPLIGTLDSARTQVVMQNLLDAIVQTRSDFAIIDITGVPVVDTLVAQRSAQDGCRGAARRSRLSDQWNPKCANRADHHPSRRGFGERHHQGHPGGRIRCGAAAQRSSRDPAGNPPQRAGEVAKEQCGANSDLKNGRLSAGHDPGGYA